MSPIPLITDVTNVTNVTNCLYHKSRSHVTITNGTNVTVESLSPMPRMSPIVFITHVTALVSKGIKLDLAAKLPE